LRVRFPHAGLLTAGGCGPISMAGNPGNRNYPGIALVAARRDELSGAACLRYRGGWLPGRRSKDGVLHRLAKAGERPAPEALRQSSQALNKYRLEQGGVPARPQIGKDRPP